MECKTCQWWEAASADNQLQHDMGRCRREPPARVEKANADGEWPLTYGEWPLTCVGDWCGEWRRRGKGTNADGAA